MEFDRIADKKRLDFIIASIRNHVPAGGEILDAGCGDGIISRAIGALGYQVTGVDVSEKAIAAATAGNMAPNVRFKVASVQDWAGEPLRYDAIICSEVLEHLQVPQTLLQVAHQSLKDAGVLIVTVPNGRGPREMLITRPVQLLQKNNGPVWKGIQRLKRALGYRGTTVQSSAEDLAHLQFFTQKSLTRLATASGFRITVMQASNFIEQVFPFSLLTRRSLILQRMDSRMADWLPLGWTSGFMSVWKKI